MSLDIRITQTVGEFNITHNLTEMAEQVIIDGISLYQVLWKGYEYGFTDTESMKEYLKKAVIYLEEHKQELEKYNPENGWGSYDTLVEFVHNILRTCYVDGYIEFLR